MREEVPAPHEAAEKMRDIALIRDNEARHEAADQYLIGILESLGYKEATDVFWDMDRWYA